jgi:hypothetical protein
VEETKICERCQEPRPLTSFPFRSPTSRRNVCRRCRRNGEEKDKRKEQRRRYEQKNKARINKQKRARDKAAGNPRRILAARRQRAFLHMGGRCANPACPLGEVQLPHVVYDFHHADPSIKEAGVSELLHYSWSKAKRELDKCVMLCCVCHRLLHAGEPRPIPVSTL